MDDRLWAVAVLRSLPPRQRAVLVLRYVYDLDEAAIARELGVSTGTVKSQAAKAMATLRAGARRWRRGAGEMSEVEQRLREGLAGALT